MIFFLALAAALAGIKQEDVHLDRSMSLSPPMSANTSATSAAAIYPAMGLQQAAAASAFGMLSPTPCSPLAFIPLRHISYFL